MSEYSYSAEDYDNSDMAADWGSDQIEGWDQQQQDMSAGSSDAFGPQGSGYTPPEWSQFQNITPGQYEQPQMQYDFNMPNYESTSFGQTGGMQTPEMGGNLLGSLSPALSNIFNGLTSKGGMAGIGALLEGRQNKKQAQGMRDIVQQQQQRMSPFDVASTGASQMGASSMRDAMQQKLAAAMQDPYGQPMVKAQVDQIARAQAIKDAAAGRRSNMATSSPAMLAAQAKVAQDYINSLQNPAGANMHPNQTGLDQLIQAQKYATNGYASPIMSALGYNTGTSVTQQDLAAIKQKLGIQ